MEFQQWRRLPVSESADHRAKPLLCRGIRDYIRRMARDDGTVVQNAASEDKAIDILLAGCSAHPEELSTCKKYVREWIEDGWLAVKRQKKRVSLWIPTFFDEQNKVTAGALRMRKHRAGKKGKKHTAGTQNVNENKQLKLVTGDASGDVTRDASGDVTRSGTDAATVTVQKERKRQRKKERKKEIGDSLQHRALAWLQSPDGAMSYGPPHTWPQTQQVLECCNGVWNTTTRIANSADPRVTAIVDRFSEGFTVDDLCEAIEGSRNDKFIADNRSLQCCKTLLGTAQAVDKYSRLLQEPQAAPAVQPAAGSYYRRSGFEQSAPAAAQLAPEDPFEDG